MVLKEAKVVDLGVAKVVIVADLEVDKVVAKVVDLEVDKVVDMVCRHIPR